MRTLPLALVSALLALAVAQEETPGNEAVERGRKVFHDTQGLEYPACAHCHSLVPEAEEAKKAKHLGPGGTLHGAAVRSGWRNMNTYADVGEASQLCAKRWQKRKRGLKSGPLQDLVAFLKTQAPKGGLPKRKVQKRPKLLKELDGGDAAKGKLLMQRYCGGCHYDGDDAISIILRPNKKKKTVIARTVRGYDAKRQFKPQKGSMSYYTTDRLSDDDLRHIIAYLGR